MGLWAPFVAHAMTNGNTLGPYSIAVFLTLGALLSCLIWNTYFMKHPLVGEPVSFAGYFSGPMSGHVLGLLGGFIWGIGMVFNLVAASFTGVAISYAIGQSAPMVAAPVSYTHLDVYKRQTQTTPALSCAATCRATLMLSLQTHAAKP